MNSSCKRQSNDIFKDQYYIHIYLLFDDILLSKIKSLTTKKRKRRLKLVETEERGRRVLTKSKDFI